MDLIAVPFNSSGGADGVARAPAALLPSLTSALPDARVVTADVPAGDPRRGPSGLAAEAALTAMVTSVSERVLDAWAADRVPIVLGGDCPVLLGGLVAAERRRYGAGLVFVDGHEDAWDPHASPTGEAADSEIALALGLASPPAVDYPQPGGLSWEQLESLTGQLLRIGGCGGLSVCIYNPDLDGGAAAGRIAGYVAGAARLLS